MKKFLAILLCLLMVVPFVVTSCGNTEAEYKLGMGVVVNMDSSADNNAQVDATVAAVVTDADGKIVALRLDSAQNKMNVTNGAVDTAATFLTKMEKGNDYNMATWGANQDNNGDGVVKEWFEQAKAFEAWAVGKTASEIVAMPTQTLDNDFGTAGYVISADEALLTAGCTIQVGDFVDAVAKACNDAQGMTFKSNGEFTLGVAAKTTVDSATVAATADANGSVNMYTDFAAAVVADGKIVATLNDAIQPKIEIAADGKIVSKTFVDTKRELKEDYGMGGKPYSPDNDGDGEVLEWYVQSEAFSKYVVGMTGAEVAAMKTKEANDHLISADDALLEAGCTIQITGICAVVSLAAANAR